MTIRNLRSLLDPRSIAVIGATRNPAWVAARGAVAALDQALPV